MSDEPPPSKRPKYADGTNSTSPPRDLSQFMQGAYKKVVQAVYGNSSAEGSSHEPAAHANMMPAPSKGSEQRDMSQSLNGGGAKSSTPEATCSEFNGATLHRKRRSKGQQAVKNASLGTKVLHRATNPEEDAQGKISQLGPDSEEIESDESEPLDSSGKRKPRWRGWVAIEEDEVPVNNQDQFAEIAKQAAAEAKQGGQGGSRPRKTLRERPAADKPPKEKQPKEKQQKVGEASRKKNRKSDGKRDSHTQVSQTKSHGSNRAEEEGASLPSPSSVNGPLHPLSPGTEKMVQVAVSKPPTPSKKRRRGSATDSLDIASRSAKIRRSSLSPRPFPPYKDDSLDSDANKLQDLLRSDLNSLEIIKGQILPRLTSATYTSNSAESTKVHQLLSQTVLAGEGNSMLVIGSRGTGKTAMVETAISDLRKDHKDDFHVVRLNGFIHTDDKIALKEIWRQLGREMDVEDELTNGRSNYADILTSLLALLSHEDELPPEDDIAQHRAVAKSVIFILDEFHLFAAHPRQTLLYNLFDLTQSSTTPLAVLGLTTRVDVTDMLEKRVKSRFGQRIVQTNPPRTFDAFKAACQASLMIHPPSPHTAIIPNPSTSTFPPTIPRLWNTYISTLLSTPSLLHHLNTIYTTTRLPQTFHTTALLPIISLSPASPLPTSSSFTSTTSLLLPPDSPLTTLLPTLSTLALALLISAARLEILLAPTTTATIAASTAIVPLTFDAVYDEYVALAAKTRLNASASGALASSGHGGGGGGRVWGKRVARGEWEGLVEVGAVVPVIGGAGGSGAAGGEGRWCVDLGGLEEIGMWCEGEGKKMVGGLGRWCRI